jgi:hypothetical protein
MSCLFNSLSHFIPQTDPQTIRQRICDYLQANSPIIDGMATHDVLQLDSKTTDQYISAMRSPCTWGGAIEIQAACNIWNARIVVHDIRSGHRHRHGPGQGHGQTIEFLPVSTNAADKTFELEWSGGHYEPVRR